MYLFLIIIFVLIIIIFYKNNSVYIRSDIDNKYYLVNDLYDSKQASNLLSYLYYISNYLIDKILNEDNKTDYDINYYKYVLNIKKKLYNLKIKESKITDNNTHTVNKGETIVICLRNKQNFQLHDKNILIYVIIHELAHIGCPEIGHTNLFYQINKYLLNKAIQYDIYIYENYNNKEYCGHNIISSILD